MKCFLWSLAIGGLSAMVSTLFLPDQVSGLVFLTGIVAAFLGIGGLAFTNLSKPKKIYLSCNR